MPTHIAYSLSCSIKNLRHPGKAFSVMNTVIYTSIQAGTSMLQEVDGDEAIHQVYWRTSIPVCRLSALVGFFSSLDALGGRGDTMISFSSTNEGWSPRQSQSIALSLRHWLTTKRFTDHWNPLSTCSALYPCLHLEHWDRIAWQMYPSNHRFQSYAMSRNRAMGWRAKCDSPVGLVAYVCLQVR